MRRLGLFLGTHRLNPVLLVAPVVSGVGYVGTVMSCTTGTWRVTPPSYSYQWYVAGLPVGIDSPNYTITLADEGKTIRCDVTVPYGSGFATAESNTIERWVVADAAGLVAHYDAYAPATIDLSGAAVTRWRTRTLTANIELLQAEAAKQPTYSATGWDGTRPSVTFDGSFDAMRAGLTSILGENKTGITLAAVATIGTVVAGNRLLFMSSNGFLAVSSRSALRVVDGTDIRIGGRRLDGDTYKEATSVTAGLGARILSGQQDHANDRARSNPDGTLSAWTTPYLGTGPTSFTKSQGTALAVNGGGSENSWWDGKISEMLEIDTTLSDADMDKLHGYLAWRWGIEANLPLGHPYKSTPPNA